MCWIEWTKAVKMEENICSFKPINDHKVAVALEFFFSARYFSSGRLSIDLPDATLVGGIHLRAKRTFVCVGKFFGI